MRTTKSRRVGSQLAVAALALCAAKVARADVSTNRPGSILIFPKVVATTTRDTIIQISNSLPITVHAHCYYIDASLNSHTGLPQWQETDFSIWLTRLQPTHFRVSQGRTIDPSDNYTTTGKSGNAGLDPGVVPPAPIGFTGELVCVEVDADGMAMINNALTGTATLGSTTSGDVAKYNGTAIHGINNSDNTLQLDNVEYNACPSSLRVDLPTEGTADPAVQALGNGGTCSVAGTPCQLGSTTDCPMAETCVTTNASSSVSSFLTFVPCSADFENLVPATTRFTVDVFDEFEGRISATPGVVTCWTNQSVVSQFFGNAAFSTNTGSGFKAAVIVSTNPSGLLAVAETVVTDTAGNSASTLSNPMVVNQVGTVSPGAVIHITQ